MKHASKHKTIAKHKSNSSGTKKNKGLRKARDKQHHAAIDSNENISTLREIKEKIMKKYDNEQAAVKANIEPESVKPQEIISEPVISKPVMPVHAAPKSIPAAKPAETEKDIILQEHKCRVEAVLFAMGKYIDEETIAHLCEMDKRQVKKALLELKNDYDSRKGALIVFQEGDSWKINVHEKYLSLVRKIVADTELSKSVMETLAVIAWKTPVYQNAIVKIRGNKCYDHIEELVDAGFVTKDRKGRSYILKTTDKFYNYFDIDQKNLHGVMSEARMPAQTTLEEVKEEEIIVDSKEKLLHTLETIETRKIVRTDDEKIAEQEFLSKMHQKIEEAAKKTDEYASDIPRPMHEQQAEQAMPEEQDTDTGAASTVIDKDEEDIVISTDASSGDHHFQKPTEQPQKPKQLTKKQLEKKFKDELQRVKEKGSAK
jgi:segregation and condensation protein B